jgi:hypothetical protein
MDVVEKNPFRLTRAGVTMLVWGLLLLAAGIYNQYNFPSVEGILFLWGAITLVGFVAQAVCEIQHAAVNFYVWIGAVAVAWAFTYYVTKWDNGAHGALYPDLPGIWLIFLGIGYLDTARTIRSKFAWIAGAHLVAGVLLELSAHGLPKIDFLNTYSTLIFGIVAGGTLIAASVTSRVPAKATTTGSAVASQSPA